MALFGAELDSVNFILRSLSCFFFCFQPRRCSKLGSNHRDPSDRRPCIFDIFLSDFSRTGVRQGKFDDRSPGLMRPGRYGILAVPRYRSSLRSLAQVINIELEYSFLQKVKKSISFRQKKAPEQKKETIIHANVRNRAIPRSRYYIHSQCPNRDTCT